MRVSRFVGTLLLASADALMNKFVSIIEELCKNGRSGCFRLKVRHQKK